MMFDLDAFEERAAIMEFDGGLSRFRAETAAAQSQGVSRHEAIRIRNTEQARDQRQAAVRNAKDNMPRVQQRQEKEKRTLPVRELLVGWSGLALLALPIQWGGLV